MDESLDVGSNDFSSADVVDAQFEQTTAPFVGRWNRLVSQTNWEKGRIISAWRQAMADSGAAAGSLTDDAWATRVGGVTPQHVGRLRRVWDRFGSAAKQYAGLFWSHFQAALDWDDAEMWLEGATQNRWSISQMRAQRAESLGAPDDLKPREEDVLQAELDDEPAANVETAYPEPSDEVFEPDFGDEDAPFDAAPTDDAPAAAREPADEAAPPVRPFESLPALPPDLNEAFENFKLAIVGRRVGGWQDISRDDMLAVLEALRQLVLAPT